MHEALPVIQAVLPNFPDDDGGRDLATAATAIVRVTVGRCRWRRRLRRRQRGDVLRRREVIRSLAADLDERLCAGVNERFGLLGREPDGRGVGDLHQRILTVLTLEGVEREVAEVALDVEAVVRKVVVRGVDEVFMDTLGIRRLLRTGHGVAEVVGVAVRIEGLLVVAGFGGLAGADADDDAGGLAVIVLELAD